MAQSGFRTIVSVDQDKASRDLAVQSFTDQSKSADVALIYSTGHGVQIDGRTQLLMKDFRQADGKGQLPDHSFSVAKMATLPKAKRLNAVFFAGCRNNPLHW